MPIRGGNFYKFGPALPLFNIIFELLLFKLAKSTCKFVFGCEFSIGFLFLVGECEIDALGSYCSESEGAWSSLPNGPPLFSSN